MKLSAYDVVRRPRVTEKSVHLHNAGNQYTFEVHTSANKVQIKEAIAGLFKVEVVSVRTVNCLGKWRRTRMGLGRKPAWKKAMVTLAEGQQIEGL